MRMKRFYLPTLREVPVEAEIPSHQLLLRAGMIRKAASGIYTYLPLGYRVVRKIENVVREEMDRAGAQEIRVSNLQPREIWEASGRWATFGPEMFRVSDRHNHEYCLGPTAEESFTDVVKEELRSYKQLPLNLYQIGWKYRDEKRPRFGINRSREFLMKDAYSFDIDEEGMTASYQTMWDAYVRVFDRLGIDYRIVQGDSGAMGGHVSHEFTALSEIGEGQIVYCDCGYAATDEKAGMQRDGQGSKIDASRVGTEEVLNELPLEEVATPDVQTIEELEAFLQEPAERMIKTVALRVAGEPVLVFLPAERELNVAKLVSYLQVPEFEIEMLDEEGIREATGGEAGYIGPVGLPETTRVIYDRAVTERKNLLCGANKKDTHLRNVNYGRDFTGGEIVDDLWMVQEGDRCPICGKPLQFARGIEVGNIFQLGTKYSEPLGATVLDEDGVARPLVMGSYGIGITRTISAIVEQNHDEKGMSFPLVVAPFHVILTVMKPDDETQSSLMERMEKELEKRGVEVLVDDRKDRPGVKFNDRDLIGIPLRITIGKRAGEGIVEYSTRTQMENEDIAADEAMTRVVDAVNEAQSGFRR